MYELPEDFLEDFFASVNNAGTHFYLISCFTDVHECALHCYTILKLKKLRTPCIIYSILHYRQTQLSILFD